MCCINSMKISRHALVTWRWHYLLFLFFRFGLTAFYILSIQHFTRVCGKISVKLIKHENNETTEKRADSLVYKVLARILISPFRLLLSLVRILFRAVQDLYCSCRSLVFTSCSPILEFSIMPSCTAIFWLSVKSWFSASLCLRWNRFFFFFIFLFLWILFLLLLGPVYALDLEMLYRCLKICWKILYPILSTATKNTEFGKFLLYVSSVGPLHFWLTLHFTFFAHYLNMGWCILLVSRDKKKREKGFSTRKIQFTTRVEKEYMKSSYSASIGEELEDGLFDGNSLIHI